MTAGSEDGLYKGGGGGTAFRGEAATQALRSPLGVSRMCLGHVLWERGMPAACRGAQVTCHALAAVQHLDCGGGEPHLDLLLHQRVGHRVIVAVGLDVIVDMHPRG